MINIIDNIDNLIKKTKQYIKLGSEKKTIIFILQSNFFSIIYGPFLFVAIDQLV